MLAEQYEQISEVLLNFHGIVFSNSLLLLLALQGALLTIMRGLSLWRSDPSNLSC